MVIIVMAIGLVFLILGITMTSVLLSNDNSKQDVGRNMIISIPVALTLGLVISVWRALKPHRLCCCKKRSHLDYLEL